MTKEKYMTRTKEISLNIVHTALESVRRKDITKTGIRIYKDGLIGTSGALGNADEDELQKQAETALENGIRYPYDVCSNRQQKLNLSCELIREDMITLINDRYLDLSYNEAGLRAL